MGRFNVTPLSGATRTLPLCGKRALREINFCAVC